MVASQVRFLLGCSRAFRAAAGTHSHRPLSAIVARSAIIALSARLYRVHPHPLTTRRPETGAQMRQKQTLAISGATAAAVDGESPNRCALAPAGRNMAPPPSHHLLGLHRLRLASPPAARYLARVTQAASRALASPKLVALRAQSFAGTASQHRHDSACAVAVGTAGAVR